LPNTPIGVPAQRAAATPALCPSTSAILSGHSREQLGREPRVECLHGRAGLQPNNALGERSTVDLNLLVGGDVVVRVVAHGAVAELLERLWPPRTLSRRVLDLRAAPT
jgi:hypothetical protein